MKLLKIFSISLFVFLSIASTTFASSTDKVFGQAWSSNIGWISFNNCTSASSCSGVNYGVTIDTNGNLSGQAWSSNIGWLSFNATSGCPITGCVTQPKINLTTGVFSGWARFIGNGGGWDGWVNLNGLVINTSTSAITGHAWGSEVVGWIVPMASLKATLPITPTLPLSGTLTPASPTCNIPLNGSSCNVNLSWSTTNPVGTSAVTASGMTDVNGNTGTSKSFVVPYSSTSPARIFYLYNNAIKLATANATSSCIGGTSWNGTACVASPMSGTLTPKSSHCDVPLNGSNCSVNLSWTTTNPMGTSFISSNGVEDPTDAVGNTGTKSFVVPYTTNYSTTFWLSNNTVPLASSTATLSCIAGTSWNGTKCVTFPMSGTLTPPSSTCDIPLNGSSCNVNLSWTTTNPVGTSAVTASGMTDENGNTGTKSFVVPYSSRTFYLYNNAVLLDTSTATSACVAGTVWDGTKTKCVAKVVDCPLPLTQTVTVSCDPNEDGQVATSGSVTRSQTKSAYPQCTFGTPVTTANSTFVSDNCAYLNYSHSITVNASDCKINIGDNSCVSTFYWRYVTDPPATFVNTLLTITTSSGDKIIGTSLIGTGSFNLPYGPNGNTKINFDGKNPWIMARISAEASCVDGAEWNGTKCVRTVLPCSDPLTKDVTVACDVVNGFAATSGSVTRSQTKSAYTASPSCAFGTPVTTLNSTYVSDNCKYSCVGPSGYTKCSAEDGTCSFTGSANVAYGCNPSFNYKDASGSVSCSNNVFGDPLPNIAKSCFYKTTPCSAPLTKDVTVACDAKNGVPAISGSVTRSQTKTSPQCTFGTPVTTANSTYVSETCKYPTGTWSFTSTCPTACGKPQTYKTQVCVGGNGICSGTPMEVVCPATEACAPVVLIPDLKVSEDSNYVYASKVDGPLVVSYASNFDPYDGKGYPYTLSWSPIANATSCQLDHSYNISNPSVAGSVTWQVSNWAGRTHTFDLVCTGAGGITGADSVTLSFPPAVSNLTRSCNASNTIMTLNWTAPSGYNTFYTRASSLSRNDYTVVSYNGSTALYDDNVVGATDSFAVHPDETYKVQILAKASSRAHGAITYADVTCATAVVATCSDGIKNQNETGIDTGGVCALPLSGTLTPTSPTCDIPLNGSSCNVNLSWTTTNPVGTSAVTASGMTSVNGNTGTSKSFIVPYSSTSPARIFYLYNNAIKLATANATSRCTGVTFWNGTKCVAVVGPTCFDGIKNQNETGIDTGGVCGNPPTGTWSYSSACPTDCGTAQSTQTQICTGGNGSCSGTAETRTCNATDACPPPDDCCSQVTNLKVTYNGNIITNSLTGIPYNSKVNVSWSSEKSTSCSCKYTDSNNPNGSSCVASGVTGVTGSFQSPALKRDTTYTVTCEGTTGIEDSESVIVKVNKINTDYTEQ